MRRYLGLFAALLCALAAVLAAPTAASAATTETFDYTGGVQTWTVPPGVTSGTFDVYGASGGESGSPGFEAGKGGRARSVLALTPGSTVYIVVGGAGAWPGAGYNGGGNGSWFGGGGATDIRIGGRTLDSRVLVAGGGGGAAQYTGQAGHGGGLTGTGAGGGGGTQTAGGSGTYPDWKGSFGQGGTDGGVNMIGGGGGGWYGGGGGQGGGGGGSGYGPAGVLFETGVSEGNGSVTITVPERTLTVATRGTNPGPQEGRGYIQSSPSGIDCGWLDRTACSRDYLRGTPVTLTATPIDGWTFVRWDGDCTGTTTTCDVSMEEARDVRAIFEITRIPLTVTKPGNGSGLVTSTPPDYTTAEFGINCGSTCSARYLDNESVTLTAAAATGSDFAGWSGDCSGTSTTCTVSMAQARDVEARFTLQKRALSVSGTGDGSGSITSSPVGLNCGSTCSADFDYGTEVKLTANPATGSSFTGWGPGACQASGTSPTCTVTMDQARTAQAGFTLEEQRTLSVTKSATGTGTVASDPAGIDCGSACSEDYDYGTEVTLTATPGPNSKFVGWSGDCSGTSTTCTVAMSQARTVEANFTFLTNGGFETGDLSGWTTTGVPNGAATAQTSFTCPAGQCFNTTVSPVEGSKFALLTPGDADVYTTLSQTFTAGAGEEISGQARFLSQEAANSSYYNDQAEVVIKDASNNEVTVFSAQSLTNSTPWTHWQNTFSVAGTYTVEARVKNMWARSPSRLALDAVSLGTADPQAPTAKDDPTTAGDSKYSVDQDGSLTVSASDGVLANDTDPGNDPLTAMKTSDPKNGTLTLNSADGSFTYKPRAGYSGTDSFTYKANDGTNDSNVATVTLTVNPDTTAPTATIDSGPSGTTNIKMAEFAFSSSEEGSSFECSLDGSTYEDCTSPKRYEDLQDGSYTFYVKATDKAGNPSYPVSQTWTVDTTAPPTVASVTPTNGKTGVSRTRPNITATFSESVDKATVEALDPTTQKSVNVKLVNTATGKQVAATVSCDADPCNKVTITPKRSLAANTKHKATVTTGVEDLAGNALDQNLTTTGYQPKNWTFTTRR